jgi:ectoine hydroxylase-related dioxygenase (phytanoyl-CoA dioxygenase family)
MTSPSPVASALTAAERFIFDTQGYLVLENFLKPDHLAKLLAATSSTTARRREQVRTNARQTGFTQVNGQESTRVFYILDDDPLFLELLDWPAILPYVHALLNPKPHHCASDVIVAHAGDFPNQVPGWHIDGHDDGFRNLGRPIPLLQLKIGYYLTDMTQPGASHLMVVPGSHKSRLAPGEADANGMLPGAVQVCAPAGSAILFHNALWHGIGPFHPGRSRTMLYYAYEHPWMVASQEHWGYPKDFYNHRLSPAQRKFFHGFLFDPPEQRWG